MLTHRAGLPGRATPHGGPRLSGQWNERQRAAAAEEPPPLAARTPRNERRARARRRASARKRSRRAAQTRHERAKSRASAREGRARARRSSSGDRGAPVPTRPGRTRRGVTTRRQKRAREGEGKKPRPYEPCARKRPSEPTTCAHAHTTRAQRHPRAHALVQVHGPKGREDACARAVTFVG